MGGALPKGGPAGLFLGFCIYGTVMVCVNQCFAEMITYMPIASPFVRLSGFWVDEALNFAMGWNYFFLMGECIQSTHSISSADTNGPTQPSVSPTKLPPLPSS